MADLALSTVRTLCPGLPDDALVAHVADAPTTAGLLDCRAAAAHLGLSEKTLRRATSNGALPVVKLYAAGDGKRPMCRWRAEDLDAWVNASTVVETLAQNGPRALPMPPPRKPGPDAPSTMRERLALADADRAWAERRVDTSRRAG